MINGNVNHRQAASCAAIVAHMASADEVLGYWFGEPARDAAGLGRKLKRWYMGGSGEDAVLTERHLSRAGEVIGLTQPIFTLPAARTSGAGNDVESVAAPAVKAAALIT